MNFLIKNEYRTEITLSSRELADYGITYEELDYGNIGTRRLLWALQGEVKRSYGYTIPLSGKVLIEVIKEQEDCIRICFSSLDAKSADGSSVKQLVKSCACPVIAEFSDLEEMLFAASLLTAEIKSSLFEKNGKYRLLFSPSSEKREELILCLCEFSEILESSPRETAECSESWNIIAESNAISCLHRLF